MLVLLFGLYVTVYFFRYRIILSSIVATSDLFDNRQRYVIVDRFRRIDEKLWNILKLDFARLAVLNWRAQTFDI